jgi:hypothetical protein
MSFLVLKKDIPIIQNLMTKNNTYSFHSTDKEKDYLLNKEKMGKDWYYYNKEIEYKFNSWGYRSTEFDELGDDFIVTFGCSSTEGIGLHYDDMWSTKLGKELNCNVLNLGVGSTGVDFQYYNSILLHNYLMSINKKPKYVVYQWPSQERTTASFLFNENTLDVLNFEPFTVHFDEDNSRRELKDFYNWYKTGFIEDGGELLRQSIFQPMVCNNLWNSFGVNVINWTWESLYVDKINKIIKFNFEIQHIIDDVKYWARDLGHNGHTAQDKVVNILLEKIKNL